MNKKIAKWIKKEAEALPIEVGMRLVSHNNEAFTVNHYEVMKKLYKQHGEASVKNYITQHGKKLQLSTTDTQKLSQTTS